MKSIIIYSGKGGVGKTTTTANIAKTFAENGKKVFIIDADINTPSMGVIFGNEHPHENIWVASTSFQYKNLIYLEKAMVRKFLRSAIDKINTVKPDYVLIDTPPSITDVHINLLEVISISMVVIVTQPNELSRTDVNRTAMFFTERCKEAACIIVENMCKDESSYEYMWRCIERIPFVENFDGSSAIKLYSEKYNNIVKALEELNAEEVRMESKRRILFDETITREDLPYVDGDGYAYDMVGRRLKSEDVKFINLSTWEDIREHLNRCQVFPDRFLTECTYEKVARLVKAFEFDDEAYFFITSAPTTEIELLPGEIGKGSLFVSDSYYGIPRIKYQTRKGEVILFPYEVKPASEIDIRNAMEDGSQLSSDGRYIPSKQVCKEIYETFGERVGISENWEDVWDRIMNQNTNPKPIEPINTTMLAKVKSKKSYRHGITTT